MLEQLCKYTNDHWTLHLKIVRFMVCELHLKKKKKVKRVRERNAMCLALKMEKKPWPKECRKLEKAKTRFSSWARGEISPIHFLISAYWDPCQTSNLHNYCKINLSCFILLFIIIITQKFIPHSSGSWKSKVRLPARSCSGGRLYYQPSWDCLKAEGPC